MSSEFKSSEPNAAAPAQSNKITFEVWEPAQPPMAPTEPSPYIPLAYPDEALAHLQQADQVVIPAPSIQLVVNYPLSRAFEFKLTAPNADVGFTRRQLAQQIADLYERIYREEEETGPPPAQSFSLNRGTSYGRYGIRMHDLGDLVLHTVFRRADGKYTLGIDS